MIRVITDEGSIYNLNTVARTWRRSHKTQFATKLRRYEGRYNAFSFQMGKPLRIYCPSYVRGAEDVEVVTAPVIRVSAKRQSC
jgi:hypothetical protein